MLTINKYLGGGNPIKAMYYFISGTERAQEEFTMAGKDFIKFKVHMPGNDLSEVTAQVATPTGMETDLDIRAMYVNSETLNVTYIVRDVGENMLSWRHCQATFDLLGPGVIGNYHDASVCFDATVENYNERSDVLRVLNSKTRATFTLDEPRDYLLEKEEEDDLLKWQLIGVGLLALGFLVLMLSVNQGEVVHVRG